MTTTSSRQFDIQTDKAYDPDSMSDVYLSEEQVSDVVSSLSFNAPMDIEALKLIQAIEKLQREKCLGVISADEEADSSRKLQLSFRNRFHCWAYATDAYREFYRHFGVDDE